MDLRHIHHPALGEHFVATVSTMGSVDILESPSAIRAIRDAIREAEFNRNDEYKDNNSRVRTRIVPVIIYVNKVKPSMLPSPSRREGTLPSMHNMPNVAKWAESHRTEYMLGMDTYTPKECTNENLELLLL